jgi:hypothetical protein
MQLQQPSLLGAISTCAYCSAGSAVVLLPGFSLLYPQGKQ